MAMRIQLLRLSSGDTVAVRCSDETAEAGEAEGLWECAGSAVPMTLAEARRTARAAR